MKCKRVEKLLTAFMDGELSEEDRGAVSEHLAGCKRCRQWASEARRVLAWAGTWRDREPSAGFVAGVKARATAVEEPVAAWLRPGLPHVRTALAGVAAACVVFLLGYLSGVGFSVGKGTSARAPTVALGRPPSKGVSAVAPGRGGWDRLIVGIQKIKMTLGRKLSETAYSQLDEIQRVLASHAGADAKAEVAVVEELQRAEELIREKRFAEARLLLDGLEQSHPGHPLVPYSRMTKALATRHPGYGADLVNSVYAMLLQDTVADPRELYNRLTAFPVQVTEYGWQKIVESADRFNPVNILGYIEDRLASGATTL